MVLAVILSSGLITTTHAIPPSPYRTLANPVTHTMTIRVALAGLQEIDRDRLMWNLEPEITPIIQVDHGSQALAPKGSYGVSYGSKFILNYDIVTVPQDTVSALRAYLQSISVTQSVPKSLQGKGYWSAASDSNKYVTLDALKTEEWINNHATHFSGIPDDGYLLIVANLPDISTLYHYYEARYSDLDKASTRSKEYATNFPYVDWTFSWGGRHQFYYLDLSAGDPKFDYSRTGHIPIQDFGIQPWSGRLNYNPRTLTDYVADHITETVRNLFIPSYAYAPTYAPSYEIVINVFDDTGRLSDRNIGDYLSTSLLREAFQRLIPYATWSVVVNTHQLSDDAELAKTAADSMISTNPPYYDLRQPYSYLQSHLSQYIPAVNNTIVLPVFDFVFKDDGSFASIWQEYVGDGDPTKALGGVSLGDLVMISSSEWSLFVVGRELSQITIHELGHLVGLMHPHTYGSTEDYVSSSMSYLTYEYNFSQFDADAIQRAHADFFLSQIQGAILTQTVNSTFHSQAQDLLGQAKVAYDTALSSYSRKEYAKAVTTLVKVPQLLDRAFDAEIGTIRNIISQTTYAGTEPAKTLLERANALVDSATIQKDQGNLQAAYGSLAEASASISDVQQAKRQTMASTDTQVPIVLIIGLTIGIAAGLLIFRRTNSLRNSRSNSIIQSFTPTTDAHFSTGLTETQNPVESVLTGNRDLIAGILVLVICVMTALLVAVHEYFWVGEFFALHDIMHHEVVEVTFVALGVGAFSAIAGPTFLNHIRRPNPVQHPLPRRGYLAIPQSQREWQRQGSV